MTSLAGNPPDHESSVSFIQHTPTRVAPPDGVRRPAGGRASLQLAETRRNERLLATYKAKEVMPHTPETGLIVG